MFVKFIIVIFTALAFQQIASAANSCRSIFANPPMADEYQLAALTDVKSQNKTSTPQNLNDLLYLSSLKDKYSNIWQLHPDDSYIKMNFISDSPESLTRQNYFRKILVEIQSELYSREKANARRYPKNSFLKSILLKSEDGDMAEYTDIDFFFDKKKISFLDFNVKLRLGNKMGYDEWESLIRYLGFLKQVYQKKLSVDDAAMSRLEKISIDVLSRSTLLYSDQLIDSQRRSTEVGLVAVESRGISEVLPSETLHQMSIRELMSISDETGVIELGRFGKDENVNTDTTELIKLMVSSIATRPQIKYVVIQVDQVRQRLWKRLGFTEVNLPEHLKNEAYYKSGTDYLMAVPVSVLYSIFFPQ
jgi:hypothetical protein